MYSEDSIKERLKNNLKTATSKLEGSLAMDNILALSSELARIYSLEISPIVDKLMLDTATGVDLDRKASDFNMRRKQATSSKGLITIKGLSGVLIEKGTVLKLDGLEFISTKSAAIGDDLSVDIEFICLTKGAVGNIKNGNKMSFKNNLNGISEAVSSTFKGGVDEESDDDFRARVYEKIRNPITSGNANHYRLWAKEIIGIKEAKVIPIWQGAGSVKVILLSSDFDVPSAEKLAEVSEYIENQRPIGASVSVVPASTKLVNISATIRVKAGFDIEKIKESVKKEIINYIKNIAFDDKKTLSYYKIGDLIFGIDGVDDITNYTINSAKNSLNQSFEEFFKVGEVIINAV